MNAKKAPEAHFPLVREKPEPNIFNGLKTIWTPVFTGVTTFFEINKYNENKENTWRLAPSMCHFFDQCRSISYPVSLLTRKPG